MLKNVKLTSSMQIVLDVVVNPLVACDVSTCQSCW